MRKRPGLGAVKFVVLGLLFITFIGFATMTLWNWLVPTLFSGPVISFWQALGLLLLGKLIFGWHNHGGGPWAMKARQRWRQRMMEHMENMTPEEKEQMRNRFRRCMERRRERWDDRYDRRSRRYWDEGDDRYDRDRNERDERHGRDDRDRDERDERYNRDEPGDRPAPPPGPGATPGAL